MGLFLQTAIIPDCKEKEAKEVLKSIAEKLPCEEYTISDLNPEECQFKEHGDGVNILFNDHCIGYEDLAEAISKKTGKTVLMLYIYDEDYWGYFLYDNGSEVDMFIPMTDYFEEVSEEQKQEVRGNAKIISDYFHVEKSSIEKYIVFWTEEMLDNFEKKAYEDDEFGQCDSWQMADFMGKLGYPYEFE